MTVSSASAVVPVDADLPGSGWLAIDEGFSDEGDGGPGALVDCVGPDFPDDDVVATAASPHFVRPPGRLVHGLGVAFDSSAATTVAERILTSSGFAACLGRSVALDLAAGATDAELLDVEVVETDLGHRARFTGGDAAGVRSVHLDIVAFRVGFAVGVLWCGDTGAPFPDADVVHLVGSIRGRGSATI